MTSVNGIVVGTTTETADFSSSGTWTINGDQLTTTSEMTATGTQKILTLNDQTLELLIEVDNTSIDLPDDPQFGTITGERTVVYTKL